jgi:hypothetical protein
MLFINRLEFSCFTDFFERIIKTRVEYCYLPGEDTVNSIDRKTIVFCLTDVQGFHLRIRMEPYLIALLDPDPNKGFGIRSGSRR